MEWTKVADVVGVVLQRMIDMWPYLLLGAVVIIGIFGAIELYRESKYYKTPWEKRAAKEEKKRVRAEERARREFWGE